MNLAPRWRVLIFVYISMLAFAIIFQAIPPVLGLIIASLEISHTQAGALMSFFALPGILIAIPGGILADVYGPRRVGIAALIIAIVGSLLVGLGPGFPLVVAGRFISGVGALTIAIIAPQTLSYWFAKEDLGSAMGIFNTAVPVGTIFTLNVFGYLAAAWNWQVPIFLTAVYSLFVLLLFFFKHPGLPGQQKQEKLEIKKRVLSLRKIGWPVWLVSAVWMMYNAAAIAFLTFTVDYYTTVGYDVSYAGFLTSLFMIGSLLVSPVVGYLTDKVGKEEYFIAGGCTALGLLLLLVPRTGLNPLILVSLIGVMAAFIPPPVFSLVPKFLPSGQVGMGYGILSSCLNVGVLLGPFLVGFFYDRAQSYLPGFNLMSIFALATVIIALLLKFINRKSNN